MPKPEIPRINARLRMAPGAKNPRTQQFGQLAPVGILKQHSKYLNHHNTDSGVLCAVRQRYDLSGS